MGVLNVTPDSFSDGGKYPTLELALSAAESMMENGADLIDVGGESTRPGAETVHEAEELCRVLPVIKGLAKLRIPASIDTRKASVALAAIGEGAEIVNDVSTLSDPKMAEVVASQKVKICIMHSQGTPDVMQLNPTYQDVVAEVKQLFMQKVDECTQSGVNRDDIWIDPGFGFGKTVDHNLQLISHLDAFVELGLPVVVGVSRKSSIGQILRSVEGIPLPVDQRLPGSLALQVVSQLRGAKIIRTHDVKESRQTVEVVQRLMFC